MARKILGMHQTLVMVISWQIQMWIWIIAQGSGTIMIYGGVGQPVQMLNRYLKQEDDKTTGGGYRSANQLNRYLEHEDNQAYYHIVWGGYQLNRYLKQEDDKTICASE